MQCLTMQASTKKTQPPELANYRNIVITGIAVSEVVNTFLIILFDLNAITVSVFLYKKIRVTL